MKSIEMLSGVLFAVVLLVSACTGSDSPTASLDEPTVDVVSSPTAEATSTATPVEPTSVPPPSDADLIEAAIDALDADGAGELVAWDVLDSSVDADGLVTLTLCGWTGDTVFDNVHSSLWVTDGPAGDVVATELGTSLSTGECLNTELIESALETRRQFESYWADVLTDPSTFATDPRGEDLVADIYLRAASDATDAWSSDGLSFRGLAFGDNASSAEAAPMLWRRFRIEGQERLEFVSCTAMDENYGLYRDDTRIDGGPQTSDVGPHSLDSIVLVVDPTAETGWQMRQLDGLSWDNCFGDNGWPSRASTWRPEEADFSEVNQ